MRRIPFAVVTVGLLGCTPGVVQPRPASDPRVFSSTPRCAYEVLGTFSRAPDLLQQIQSRGGDAVIQVKEESHASGVNSADPTIARAYSGQVVRFTDPGCKT
jgi:hypothetical protein